MRKLLLSAGLGLALTAPAQAHADVPNKRQLRTALNKAADRIAGPDAELTARCRTVIYFNESTEAAACVLRRTTTAETCTVPVLVWTKGRKVRWRFDRFYTRLACTPRGQEPQMVAAR